MLYPKSALSFFLLLLLTPGVARAQRGFTAWEEFDRPHPVCERTIPLGIGRETFFEVANDVPGRDEYNQLIKAFRAHKWQELDVGIAEFRLKYESSPLREAIAFLEVQAEFDRDRSGDEEREKAAERKLRNTLLLYPKSDFGPAIAATAGAYWLRTGNSQRSLAIYELAEKNFPGHPLSCTFAMGIAETHFQLRAWGPAEAAFEKILKECVNFRLRSAALIRKVDIAWLQDKPGAEVAYEKIIFDDNPFVERFYQPTLANLGEIKYRAGKWKEAGHFFERYLKTERPDAECRPFAMKRLADVAMHQGEKTSQVMGRYLAVHERWPKTDVGRFAYAHALLADPDLKSGAELDRRITLVDQDVDKVTLDSLRSRVFVEKGLTLLDLGQTSALSYLNKLRDKTPFDLTKGKVGEFIRLQFTRLAEGGKLAPLDSSKIFAELEEGYADWLKGSPQEAWAIDFYGRTVVRQTEKLAAADKLADALDRLKVWRGSPLWPKGGVPPEMRQSIGAALLEKLVRDGMDGEAALQIAEAGSQLKPFLEPEYRVVGWLAGIFLKTKDAKGGWLRWERELASVVGSLPKERIPLFRLASAMGLRHQQDYSGAEAALKGLDDRRWNNAIALERIALARAQGQGERAYRLLADRLKAAPADAKKPVLKEMAGTLEQTRLWSRAGDLVEAARTHIPEKEELADYYHIAGRAFSEDHRCGQAVPMLESGLRLSSSAKRSAESRFRLAKCLVSEKKPEAARLEWQKVVDMQDGFWSPLAQSEIKLLKP